MHKAKNTVVKDINKIRFNQFRFPFKRWRRNFYSVHCIWKHHWCTYFWKNQYDDLHFKLNEENVTLCTSLEYSSIQHIMLRVYIPVPCDLVESNKLAPLHGEQLPEVQHMHATVPYIEHHKWFLEGNNSSWKISNNKRKQKLNF